MTQLTAPQQPDETRPGSVDVQEPRPARARNRKAVPHARRGGDEGARPRTNGFVADRELDLALEDEERIGVLVVDVGIDRTEPRLAHELEHLVLGALVLDVELATLAWQGLALAGA